MRTNGKHEVIAQIAGPGLVLAALLGVVSFTPGIGRAQSSTASATPAATPAQEPAKASASSVAKPPAKGQHEGITVYGHWTIEVRDPDGRVVTHREFENALQVGGQTALASLLSDNASVGSWVISLCETGGSGVSCISATTLIQLQQAGSFWGLPTYCPTTGPLVNNGVTDYCYPVLTIQPPTTSVVLTGTVPSFGGASALNIDTVQSLIQICGSTVSAGFSQASCFADAGAGDTAALTGLYAFSGANIPVVPVNPNQAVTVTVSYSFSPAASGSSSSSSVSRLPSSNK